MGVLRLLVRLAVAGLLAGAAALTVLRVIQPDSRVAVGLVALTPLALVAYAAVAALVVVPALRRRGVALLVLVAALVGVGVHAWWLAPLYTGAQASPAGTERLVVMSANVEGMGRTDALGVLEAASERGVDVLALLEVTPDALAGMDEGGLSSLFPHRVGGEADGIGGTVLLSRSQLGPATRVGTRDGSLAVDLALGGETLRTLVVHPVQPLSDVDRWHRDHEAVLAAAGDDTDLLLGDLNASLDHRPLQALVDAGLRDATESANEGWQPTWPTDGSWHRVPFPVVQIDHVLVGPRLVALGTERVPLEGTDHAAILAELALT